MRGADGGRRQRAGLRSPLQASLYNCALGSVAIGCKARRRDRWCYVQPCRRHGPRAEPKPGPHLLLDRRPHGRLIHVGLFFPVCEGRPFTDESPRVFWTACGVRSTTMHLYQLTLQQASQITHTVHGNFTGTKQQVRLARVIPPPSPRSFLPLPASWGHQPC